MVTFANVKAPIQINGILEYIMKNFGIKGLGQSINREPHLQRGMAFTHLSVGVLLALIAMPAQAADTLEDTQGDYERLHLSDEEIEQNLMDNPNTVNATRLFLECTQVRTDAARLACYDKVAQTGEVPDNRKQPLDLAQTIRSTIGGNPQVVLAEEGQPDSSTLTAKNPEQSSVESAKSKNNSRSSNSRNSDFRSNDANILANVGVSREEVERHTPLSLMYDLDANDERGTWTARPHNPMYLLPLYVNARPNRSPSTPTQEEVEYSSNEMRVPELKLQVSVKTKVAQDLFDTNADLWFGYTQQSHWQVYNEDNSRPFRETNYEPEVFLTQPVTADLPFDGRLRMLGVGAVHHSNGQSDPLSRSWNRLYLMGGAEWGKLTVMPRLWTRINTDSTSRKDDNPDIEDYMGYGDIKFLYDLDNGESIAGTARLNPATGKGAIQLDYVVPFKNNVSGYLQIFHGYGESLIDYNHENTAVGVGVMLTDWRGL